VCVTAEGHDEATRASTSTPHLCSGCRGLHAHGQPLLLLLLLLVRPPPLLLLPTTAAAAAGEVPLRMAAAAGGGRFQLQGASRVQHACCGGCVR
jgi:hypothetical protein